MYITYSLGTAAQFVNYGFKSCSLVTAAQYGFKGAQAWDIRTKLFTLSDPIWIGDMGTEPNKLFV